MKQCWFLTGPTAVGKTAVGIALAQHIDGEIVSLDSMAIYRDMDIGTAKPTLSEQQAVPHHLIDLIEPHEDFSTAQYLQRAIEVCEQIVDRQRTPIFVGGTGLYLRAVLRGVFAGPAADWNFRRDLEAQAAQHDSGWLHRKLRQVDPATAARLHPNDTRRVVRALEIVHLTGQPPSQLQGETPLPDHKRPPKVFWLSPERSWLYDRIHRRVDQMMACGLEQEVRTLLHRTPPIGRTARQALGYRELIDWIQGDVETLDQAVELIKTRTRQFAKRQHTWFRNLVECRALEVTSASTVHSIVESMSSSRD